MKLIIVVVALALLTSSAVAETFTLDNSHIANIPGCRDSFKGLPRLAKRLGVRPSIGNGEMMLHTCKDGDYSLVKLIDALLDRIDRSAKP